jgi:hypothetical protein
MLYDNRNDNPFIQKVAIDPGYQENDFGLAITMRKGRKLKHDDLSFPRKTQ